MAHLPGNAGDDASQSGAHQSLAAGEPHLGDAQVGDRYPDQPADLIIGEQLGLASQARPSSGMQ